MDIQLFPCISLCYDGTTIGHEEVVLPLLNDLELQATFYANPVQLVQNPSVWNHAAAAGHEIGNGTLLAAADEDGALPSWTQSMVASDVDESKRLIELLVPEQKSHSLSLPFGKATCHCGHDYRAAVEMQYEFIRGNVNAFNRSTQINLQEIKAVPAYLIAEDEMENYVRSAVNERAWLVLTFEGIGEGKNAINLATHHHLCEMLHSDLSTFVRPLSKQAQLLKAANPTMQIV